MRKFNIEQINKNVPVSNTFPSEASNFSALDIEIGAGTGMFALNYGRENPKRCLISIEKTVNKFKKFEKAFNDCSLKNVFPVHDNGISWVAHNIEEQSVDRYFFIYPNPNPKKNDLNKRFYAMPFMNRVIETLRPSGQIFFATNEKFYKDEALEFMTKEWGMFLSSFCELKESQSPLSLFEKKYLERGHTVYHFSFSKKKLENF